jgi:hypothetical protein
MPRFLRASLNRGAYLARNGFHFVSDGRRYTASALTD